jgi:hypothetical protein
MVYTRMSDLGRNVLRAQGLLVWRGVQAVRLFRDDEVELVTEGRLTYPAPLKLPSVMALLSPGGAHDLPAHFQIRAHGGGDHLELTFTAEDVAQIIVPNDGSVDGVTVLNEVCGRVAAFGTVRGAPVSMEGPGVFEFVRA